MSAVPNRYRPGRGLFRRLSRCAAAVFLFALIGALPARGEFVAEIDAARIEVPDRSESTLVRARREGMRQVLVKLSGSRDSLQRESISSALREAQRYLIRYSYEEDEDSGPEPRLLLRFEFDGNALRKLLRDAGEPLWTSNRPTVLAWLVYNDGERRRFASQEEAPRLREALNTGFTQRGVPLQQPVYDLIDAERLSPGAAWRQSSAALTAASFRYRDTELLAGRVAELSGGRWVGDWQFLDQGRWLQRQVTAASLEEFVAEGADLAAAALAARYAVVGDDGGDLRYRIRIDGVRSYAQFTALREVLESLVAIERLQPEMLQRDVVVLRVQSAADPEQLARIIELDTRFVPGAAAGAEDELRYRWTGSERSGQ